jgi:hypothetical protein
MEVTGVVSLPGMMTGQILGGVPPAEAVKYQILVMFMITGGTGLGAVTAVLGGVYRLTDGRHRPRRPPERWLSVVSKGAEIRRGKPCELVRAKGFAGHSPLEVEKMTPYANFAAMRVKDRGGTRLHSR